MTKKGSVKPVSDAQAAVFKQNGLVLVGICENRRYGIFKFLECGHTQEVHKDQAKKWGAVCKICQADKFEREAKAAGFKIISHSTIELRMGERFYACLECGHQQIYALKNMRRERDKNKQSIRCPACNQKRWSEEAARHSLKLLGEAKSRKKDYMRYRFLSCGHEADIQRTHVRDQTAGCPDCQQQRYSEQASIGGLKYLGPAATSGKGLYQFLACGHEKEIAHTKVAERKNYACKVCLQIKHEEQAKDAGLILLGPAESKGNQYRSYQFSCGHKRDATTASVRNKNVICQECEDTYLTKPSEIYLLRVRFDSDVFLKLGTSGNLAYRVRSYGLPPRVVVHQLASRAFSTGKASTAAEKTFHSLHKQEKLPKKQTSVVFQKSGWTECYPTDMKETIITELGLTKLPRARRFLKT